MRGEDGGEERGSDGTGKERGGRKGERGITSGAGWARDRWNWEWVVCGGRGKGVEDGLAGAIRGVGGEYGGNVGSPLGSECVGRNRRTTRKGMRGHIRMGV